MSRTSEASDKCSSRQEQVPPNVVSVALSFFLSRALETLEEAVLALKRVKARRDREQVRQ